MGCVCPQCQACCTKTPARVEFYMGGGRDGCMTCDLKERVAKYLVRRQIVQQIWLVYVREVVPRHLPMLSSTIYMGGGRDGCMRCDQPR